MKLLRNLVTKKYLVPLFFSFVILASFADPLQVANAQSAGSSIVTCGETATSPKCTIGGIGAIVKGVLTLVLSIGLPLLFIFVAYRFVMAWFSLQQGNANAYKDALQKAGNAIFGFLIVVVLIGGGLYTILSVLELNQSIYRYSNYFQREAISPIHLHKPLSLIIQFQG